MKLILGEVKPADLPVRIQLRQDADGDVRIEATNGQVTAELAIVVAHTGQLCLSEMDTDELRTLGFEIDKNHVKAY